MTCEILESIFENEETEMSHEKYASPIISLLLYLTYLLADISHEMMEIITRHDLIIASFDNNGV